MTNNIKSAHPLMSECKELRDACARRCDEVGDPPCWQLNQGEDSVDVRYEKGCAECYRDIGIEVGDEIDPNAAVRDMFG